MNTSLLKKLREKHGHTQEEVADKINMSRTAYTKLEGGKTQGTPQAALALADLYQHPVEDFFRSEKQVIIQQYADTIENSQATYNQGLIDPLHAPAYHEDELLKALLIKTLERQDRFEERMLRLFDKMAALTEKVMEVAAKMP